MEVLQALDDQREFWLLTYWTDEASFQAWHRGHAYKEAHAGMPKGLKLVPGSAQLRRLRRVTE
jgi:heme-degrading monooxygenase HmoA